MDLEANNGDCLTPQFDQVCKLPGFELSSMSWKGGVLTRFGSHKKATILSFLFFNSNILIIGMSLSLMRDSLNPMYMLFLVLAILSFSFFLCDVAWTIWLSKGPRKTLKLCLNKFPLVHLCNPHYWSCCHTRRLYPR